MVTRAKMENHNVPKGTRQHSDVISFMKMTGERILQTIWGPGNRQRLLQCLYACYKVTKMAFSQCSKYKGNTPNCRILGPDLKGREPRIRGMYERESLSQNSILSLAEPKV